MIIELGRLVNDTEVKTVTANEVERKVLNNSLAINQVKGLTTFIEITAWDKTAEYIANNFKKGDEIYIEGEIRGRKKIVNDKPINSNFIKINTVKRVFGNAHTEEVNPA